VCLGGIVDGMLDDERERFVHQVAARMPEPRIDYVRLNITARRTT
jgi:trans-aconitate 2-methyltransferase